MFNGAHVVVYSSDAEADRAFIRDVLGFKHVDVGGGWLIFALPSAEVAFHPHESSNTHELYFMCDDLAETREKLLEVGVTSTEPDDEGWGILSSFQLPGGVLENFPRKRTKTAGTLALSTSPEGVTFFTKNEI